MESVRTGKAIVPVLRGKGGFDYLAEDPELAEIFNQAMTSFSELMVNPVVAGYDFSGYHTIVDVGGGHGRLLAAILAATPAAHPVLRMLERSPRALRPCWASTMSPTACALPRGRSSIASQVVATPTS